VFEDAPRVLIAAGFEVANCEIRQDLGVDGLPLLDPDPIRLLQQRLHLAPLPDLSIDRSQVYGCDSRLRQLATFAVTQQEHFAIRLPGFLPSLLPFAQQSEIQQGFRSGVSDHLDLQ